MQQSDRLFTLDGQETTMNSPTFSLLFFVEEDVALEHPLKISTGDQMRKWMIFDLAPQIRSGVVGIFWFDHIQTVVVVDQQIVSMISKEQSVKGGLDVLGVGNLKQLGPTRTTWGHIPNSKNLSHKYFSLR